MAEDPNGAHRWTRRVLGGLALVAVGAIVGWAAVAVFAPPRDVVAQAPYTFVELANGEVGSSIRLNAVAQWQHISAGANQAAGTVTSVSVAPGDEIRTGSILYSVNLQPVVVSAGATPAFRPLARGVKGADVSQLQQMLTDLQFYAGTVDGDFGVRTEAAVEKWQKSMGLEGSGIVQLGDLIFVPSLPTRATLDTQIVYRGATLGGGEPVLSALAPEPSFTIPATAAQAEAMPTGTGVEVESPDGTIWKAEVAGEQPSEASPDQVDVQLTGPGGTSICSTTCGLLRAEGETLLPSTIVTQAAVSGVVLPTAALLSAPNGSLSVIDADGERHHVELLASARGMSVIEGAPVGMRVRIPASTSTDPAR